MRLTYHMLKVSSNVYIVSILSILFHMLSRATGYQTMFHAKSDPKDRVSHIELELWLERNLRERARNAKRGSEERIAVFA